MAGINTAIFSKSGGSQGIGFAIPANMVRLVVDSALQGGTVRRPWLGASLAEVTPEIANAVGLDRAAGALVSSVTDGGPAASGGIRAGDIIVSVDGKDISDPNAFQYRFTTKGISGEAGLEVLRGGERAASFRCARGRSGESRPATSAILTGKNPLSGAKVANVSPAVADELSISETKGVAVVETEPFARAAIRPPAGRYHRGRQREKAPLPQRSWNSLLGKTARGWRDHPAARRSDNEHHSGAEMVYSHRYMTR